MQSRIYRWRDIGGILRSFILYSRTKEAGSCCRWQHLVKGRKGGREERRRFFGDFETKRESGTRRGEKVKGRKKYRGGSRRKSTKETRLQEVANAPRVTAVAQQYNPITLSCNPTSPPPSRFFLLSTPSLLVSTLVSTNLTPTPVPPSFLRLRGLRLTTRTLSKVKLTSFYFFLPPRHPSRVSPTYPHRIFSPPPLFPPPFFSLQPFLLLFLFRFSFRVPVFISLSLSLAFVSFPSQSSSSRS